MPTANFLMMLWSCLAEGCSSSRNELPLPRWIFILTLSVLLTKLLKRLHHNNLREGFIRIRLSWHVSSERLESHGGTCCAALVPRSLLQTCPQPVSMRPGPGRSCPRWPFFLPAAPGLHNPSFSHYYRDGGFHERCCPASCSPGPSVTWPEQGQRHRRVLQRARGWVGVPCPGRYSLSSCSFAGWGKVISFGPASAFRQFICGWPSHACFKNAR